MFNRRKRMMSDYARHMRSSARMRFIRSAIIGFGFLSGLWTRLGFDPGTWVQNKLETIILGLSTGYEPFIKLAFLYGPILLTSITMLLIYRRAGLWGFISVGLAYVAGLWLSPVSIVLLAVALLIALLSVRR